MANKFSQMCYLAQWFVRARFFGRRAPMQSVLFITDRCNLSCKHCSVYNHTNPTSKSYEQIREELKYCHSLGSRFVDFEGGEPLLLFVLFLFDHFRTRADGRCVEIAAFDRFAVTGMLRTAACRENRGHDHRTVVEAFRRFRFQRTAFDLADRRRNLYDRVRLSVDDGRAFDDDIRDALFIDE